MPQTMRQVTAKHAKVLHAVSVFFHEHACVLINGTTHPSRADRCFSLSERTRWQFSRFFAAH
jgi:hypothetical protein